MAPEDLVLLAAARRFLGTADAADRRLLASRPADPAGLARRAADEGLGGILALEMPSFRDAYRRIFAHNALQLAWLRRIERELTHPALVLKGAALLATAYGGRLGLRPLSDVDLLVDPADAKWLRVMLPDLGFRDLGPSWRRDDGVELDLHTELLGASFVPARALAFRLDPAVLRHSAPAWSPGSPRLRVLAPVWQTLHLSVHGLKHGHERWIWLVDLALLLPRIDPDELLEAAAAANSRRPLCYAVRLVADLFRIEVDPRLGRFPLSAMERFFVREVGSRPRRLRFGEVMTAASIVGWRDRLRFLWQKCFPQRRLMPWFHGSAGVPAYLRRWLVLVVPRAMNLIRLTLLNSLRLARPPWRSQGGPQPEEPVRPSFLA